MVQDSYFKALIRDIPDFPEPGVVFKDITPLLGNAEAFYQAVAGIGQNYEGDRVTKVAGVEARGFILAAPVALHLQAGFVPIRKPGKLPHETANQSYQLEYGTDTIEVHRDAFGPGDRVLIIDDVLATGGTAAAAVNLIAKLGADVVGVGVLVELGFLHGRDQLPATELFSLVRYDGP